MSRAKLDCDQGEKNEDMRKKARYEKRVERGDFK
jgi:hypothetical protein